MESCWLVASSRRINRGSFHNDLEGTLTEADAWYHEFRHQMEEYADKCDPPLPVERVKPRSSISEYGKRRGALELNIRNVEISSVVWATGYTCDFSWIKLAPAFLSAYRIPIYSMSV